MTDGSLDMVISWHFAEPPVAFVLDIFSMMVGGATTPQKIAAYAVSQLFMNGGSGDLTAPAVQPSLLGVLGSFDVDSDGASTSVVSPSSCRLSALLRVAVAAETRLLALELPCRRHRHHRRVPPTVQE